VSVCECVSVCVEGGEWVGGWVGGCVGGVWGVCEGKKLELFSGYHCMFNDTPWNWRWITVPEADGIRPAGHHTSFSSGLRPGSPVGHSDYATVPPSPSPPEQPAKKDKKQTSSHT